jgi:hypothetical protein
MLAGGGGDGLLHTCLMRLLLTSAGLRNPTLRQALQDLPGKPFASANIVYVPTHPLPIPVITAGSSPT